MYQKVIEAAVWAKNALVRTATAVAVVATAAVVGVQDAAAQVVIEDPLEMSDFIDGFVAEYTLGLTTALTAAFGFLVVWRVWSAARRAIG